MALRESGEDYLEAILMLHRAHGVVRSVDIADQLGVTKASVSKAMSMLEERGYVEMAKRDVRLTEKGLARAEHVLEQHLFFRDLLSAAASIRTWRRRRHAIWSTAFPMTLSIS